MDNEAFEKFVDSLFSALKEKRRSIGLTQGELGERMQKPQSVIARFESGGVRDPRISMFFQTCQALEVNPAEIMRDAFASASGVKEEGDSDRFMAVKRKLFQLNKQEKDAVTDILEGVFKLI